MISKILSQETEKILYKDKIIKLHDYRTIFSIDGCYDDIFTNILKCKTPKYISNIINPFIKKTRKYNAIEIGSGNGSLVKELKKSYSNIKFTGIDIIEEAKFATDKNLYEKYLVTKINNDFIELYQRSFDILFCISSLGMNHISCDDFDKLLNLLKPNGLLVINLRDVLFFDSDFTSLLIRYNGVKFTIKHLSHYFHRYSVDMNEIYYYSIIARYE